MRRQSQFSVFSFDEVFHPVREDENPPKHPFGSVERNLLGVFFLGCSVYLPWRGYFPRTKYDETLLGLDWFVCVCLLYTLFLKEWEGFSGSIHSPYQKRGVQKSPTNIIHLHGMNLRCRSDLGNEEANREEQRTWMWKTTPALPTHGFRRVFATSSLSPYFTPRCTC